jgi:hypothetical protein
MKWPTKKEEEEENWSSADEFCSLEILLIRASEMSLLKQNTTVMSNYLVRSLHLSFSEKVEELGFGWNRGKAKKTHTHTLTGGSDTEGCLRKEAANSISSAASSSSSPGPIPACSITSPILTTCVRACLLAHSISLFSLSLARARTRSKLVCPSACTKSSPAGFFFNVA